ncbi:MAG: hypothetical protein Q8L49_02505 [Burkholderiaceae bacterium]|nr:hypothetical protein [Burkholderiaceae bacterium]
MRTMRLTAVVAPLLLASALGACASTLLSSAGSTAQSPAVGDAPSARGDHGSGQPAPAAQPAAQPAQDDDPMETARRSVRSSAEWLARGVDSWFGDKPFTDGGSVTDGRLSVNVLKRQDRSAEWSVRFNARFRLPNIEKGGYLFIGRDNRREIVADTPGAFSRQERQLPERPQDRSFFAGLGLALHDKVDFRLGLRGGLKPYAQVRYRHAWELGARDLAEFRQTLFWSRDDRLGSTTALSYEHAYSSTLALRWLNAATITQESRKFEWSSSLGATKALGEQRQFSIAALFNGRQGSGVGVSDYGVLGKWQQRVHKDWLLGEFSLGHFWPREDALSVRGRSWALGAGLKMRF